MSIQVFSKIIKASAQLLNNYDIDVPIQKQEGLKGVIQQIKQLKFQALGLEKPLNYNKGIGYRKIYEKAGLRITLYYLPQGQIIQLHNHPQMMVVSYLLKGNLQVQHFTPINEGEQMKFLKENATMIAGDFSLIDGMRTHDKNLHQLKANENTFFLDILFPDYNEAKQCLFFGIESQLNQKQCTLRVTDDQKVKYFAI